MNTGQTMMTIGAMVLLGYTVLTTNRSSLTHGIILQQTEIGVYMISLAISRVEEASGKAFDQKTVSDIVTSSALLTDAASALWGTDWKGTDTVDVYPDFDDFDDYHNFAKTDTIPGVDALTVNSTVRYIDADDPEDILPPGTKTFHKRMDVTVTGISTSDTLRMSYIFSYWAFR
ncbi:MAG: hypothetical protein L0Y80_05545 [Ignavibacteriae bacterium]|nr:hypothetical protein [Ignavibacteriota bacterium]